MIIFEKIRFKNFLSFGNHFIEIDLNKHSTNLVLGKNGSGKSGAILDSITFALFGKAYRKINKPTVVNSINDKDCMVELYFKTNGKSYKILRGIKPVVFEIYCDGILLDPDKSKDYQEMLEMSILKMNFKTFCQVVILGSATFTPFMQLPAAGRREIIESLLDIEIFSDMNVVVREKISAIKQKYQEINFKITAEKEKVQLIQKLLPSKSEKNKEDSSKKQIEKLQEEIQDCIDKIEELIDQTKKNDTTLLSRKKFLDLQKELSQNVSIQGYEITALKDKIKLYKNNKTCPTCEQGLENHDGSHVEGLQKSLDALVPVLNENKRKLNKVEEQLLKFDELKTKNIENKTEEAKLSSLIKLNDEKIKTLKASSSSVQTEDKEKELETLRKNISILETEKEKAIEEKRYLDYCLTLLKDGGIKTKIIKQYLPIINKTVNKNLTAMNQNSNITFNLDANFDEEIRSRGRDIFSYFNFSEGEKLRVDLSLLLTWRHIAKSKNSVNTNILIMDEILDRSLDLEGVDGFMKILGDLEKQGINTFIISHKENMTDKFKNVIKFEKTGNFSLIKQND